MKPVDFRTITWQEIQDSLQGMRLATLRAFQLFGPCTTREAARRSGMDILTLRPRATELCQLGMIVLADEDSAEGHEGIYRALTDAETQAAFAKRQREARAAFAGGAQPELKLTAV